MYVPPLQAGPPTILIDANTLTLALAVLTFLTLVANFVFAQINARQAAAKLEVVHTATIAATNASNHSAEKLQAVLDASNNLSGNPLVPVTQKRIDASNQALEDQKIHDSPPPS
jgi:hypothetical protein